MANQRVVIEFMRMLKNIMENICLTRQIQVVRKIKVMNWTAMVHSFLKLVCPRSPTTALKAKLSCLMNGLRTRGVARIFQRGGHTVSK